MDQFVSYRIYNAHFVLPLFSLSLKVPLKRSIGGKEVLTYGKNEYPGEIDAEGSAAFDVICTDTNGVKFLVEVQQEKQKYFKERSVFYAGRLISDQAPKGDPNWKYDLPAVYVVCLLVKFDLPDNISEKYCHNVGFCDLTTGVQFYDKLEFIYLEIKKFNKSKEELESTLDEWLYALKYAPEMNEVPDFLKTPGLDYFFELVKFSNLTPEERNMYRTKQQVRWDNQNAFDFAREEGIEIGVGQGALAEKKAIAFEMKQDGINVDRIIKYTLLSKEQIEAL